MASIRSRNNRLVVDFYYMGKRCRETTNLIDTPVNRKKLESIMMVSRGLAFSKSPMR